MFHCPHANVVDCPLYHALHYPDLVQFGCDDGSDEMQVACAVARGFGYETAVAKLQATAAGFRLVAECEWHASLRARKEQQLRNLRVNGIH